jgi:MYXO-CTERM domain-containing protein
MRQSLPLFCVGLFHLLLPSASAFAPTDDVYTGLEPQRVRHYHAQEQAAHYRSEAWQQFNARVGGDWQARFDELTGVPHRLWGAGIDLGPLADSQQAGAAVINFIEQHKQLFRVEPGALRLRSANYVERTQQWFVDVDVLVAGYPQYRGGFTARIKHGKLISFGADHYPDAPIHSQISITETGAINTAIQQGYAPTAEHDFITAKLVALPQEINDHWELSIVWQVESETLDPPGRWVSFVDAHSGEFMQGYNQVRFFSGAVQGYHDVRTVDGNMTWSPMPNVRVSNGTDIVSANADGTFEIDEGTEYTTSFNGDFFNVMNVDGNSEFTFDGSDVEWTEDEAHQAEIDNYIFLHQILDWGVTYAPEVWYVRLKLTSYVNIDSACNAYYNGNLNFFRSGSGCNNTARIADVNYHEWGHGFHEWSLESGWFDGSLSEGAADTISFLQTNDSRLAPYFQTNGGALRDVDNQRRYPEDYVDDPNYVHYNGLIFGGAMWDFKKIVAAQSDEETALAESSRILAGLLKGGPTVETAFDEALVADDDDGDLSNGTPYECELIDAFGLHGLGPMGSSDAIITGHAPLEDQVAGLDHEININLVSPAPNCFEYVAIDALVTWRSNGGTWQETDLLIFNNTDEIKGAIPAQKLGDFVEYYLSVYDENGTEMGAPSGAYINPYSFYVGDVIPIACNDFEDDNGGFSHELLDGEDVEGADDWQWGKPRGASGDPSKAHSGTAVWGNDLGKNEYNGAYQNDKHNRLTSPRYDLAHHQGAFLHYYRWLTVEDGFYDHASIIADGEIVWTNWGTKQDGVEHHLDNQWMPHAVDLASQTSDHRVQISWEINSDQGLAMGGWNIDDVCIFSPATANNRLGITDFQASDGLEREIELSWTNPSYAPLERILVIRNQLQMPLGPISGTIVYDDRAPELGAPVSLIDAEIPHANYAVYGFDGTEWLSWTQEGWNADKGSARGFSSLSDEGARGCACASSPSAPRAWLLALPSLLLALLIRRRQEDFVTLD